MGLALGVSGEAFRPDSVAVLPIAQLSPIVGQPITGILGHDFFAHEVITVDYARREVLLAAADSWTAPAGATPLPVWIEAGEPFVPATFWVAGCTVPGKLKLDTGSLSASRSITLVTDSSSSPGATQLIEKHGMGPACSSGGSPAVM